MWISVNILSPDRRIGTIGFHSTGLKMSCFTAAWSLCIASPPLSPPPPPFAPPSGWFLKQSAIEVSGPYSRLPSGPTETVGNSPCCGFLEKAAGLKAPQDSDWEDSQDGFMILQEAPKESL